jgi:hypothetical protein
MLRLPIIQTARNIWGILMNRFHAVTAGDHEYFSIVTNGNNPPTVKANTRFQVYKEDNSYTIDPTASTGDNEYVAGDTPTYPAIQGIIEPSDVTSTYAGTPDFPTISDGTWYMYCRGCLNTNSTTRGQGSYWISKTDAPAVDYKKGGYYNTSDGLSRCICQWTVSGSAVSALIVYKVILPYTMGTAGYMVSSNGDGTTSWVAPSAAATYPLLNITGTIAHDTDTDHDILFGATICADSTNAYIMSGAAITKQIDASWAVGDDAGGLFSGSVAANTVYYFHEIRKDSDGSIDYGFDTSATAANRPAGHTYYRCIGAGITNASSNWHLGVYTRSGSNLYFRYITASNDMASSSKAPSAKALLTVKVPANAEGVFNVNFVFPGSNTYAYVIADADTDYTLTADTCTAYGASGGQFMSIELRIPVNASSQIAWKVTDTTTMRVNTIAWRMSL